MDSGYVSLDDRGTTDDLQEDVTIPKEQQKMIAVRTTMPNLQPKGVN